MTACACVQVCGDPNCQWPQCKSALASGAETEEAARNELAGIRLYLESCGLEGNESIIGFLRGWKQNGPPMYYRDGRERFLR